MAALDPTLGNFLAGLAYTVLAAFVIAVTAAVVRTFSKHQADARDAQGLREFFFDTPGNPRTGVPPKKGWTTLVDERQDRIERKVDAVLGEVKPNGGHNLRGAVDRAAKNAEDP